MMVCKQQITTLLKMSCEKKHTLKIDLKMRLKTGLSIRNSIIIRSLLRFTNLGCLKFL